MKTFWNTYHFKIWLIWQSTFQCILAYFNVCCSSDSVVLIWLTSNTTFCLEVLVSFPMSWELKRPLLHRHHWHFLIRTLGHIRMNVAGSISSKVYTFCILSLQSEGLLWAVDISSFKLSTGNRFRTWASFTWSVCTILFNFTLLSLAI